MAVFICTHLNFYYSCAIISVHMIKSKKMPKSTRASSKASKEEEDIKIDSNSSSPNFFLITIIGIVVIAAVVVFSMNYLKKDKSGEGTQVKQNQQQEQTAENDLDRLINRVSELIEINKDEIPTIATVQEPDVLKETQPVFYKDAEKGDRLLVWSDKAVLYSVSKDKLISVMLIDQNQMQATSTQPVANIDNTAETTSTVALEDPQITVLNGTRTAGLAGKMKTKLVAGDLKVVSIGDAALKTYTSTTIVKLTDKEMPATLKALKELTGAEVVTSLEGETALKGDFTVIVGENFTE